MACTNCKSRFGRYKFGNVAIGFANVRKINEPNIQPPLNGLVQWLEGLYVTETLDVDGTDVLVPVNGEIYDKSTDEGADTPQLNATPSTGVGLDFDGVNDNINLGDVNDLGTSDATLCAWVKAEDLVSTMIVAGKGRIDGSDANLYFLIIDAGRVRGVFLGNSGSRVSTGFNNPLTSTTEWYHIAVVFDRDGDMIPYINGVEQSSNRASISTFDGDDLNSAEDYVIGDGFFFIQRPFDGKVAGVKQFNTVLTSDQILQLYRNPNLVVPSNSQLSELMLDMPMVEGVGVVNYDYSSGYNDGNINGATWMNPYEFPSRQLVTESFNLSGTNQILLEDPNNTGFDIVGGALTAKNDATLNFPYSYHDGVETAHNAAMNPTDGLTISFWTEWEFLNQGDADNYIIEKDGFGIIAQSSSSIFIDLVTVTALSNPDGFTGVRNYCLVVDSAGDVELYNNGVLQSTTITGESIPTGTGALKWAENGGSESWINAISDPMYYNRKLTSTEVSTIYNSQKSKY